MDLVYNRSSDLDDLVVFAEPELADAVSTIRLALRTARTWGEFGQSLPEGEWAELLERLEEAPDAAAPFDADEVPGHADGDYPTWLAARMVDIIPIDVVTKYGSRFDSVLNGEAVELPWAQAEESPPTSAALVTVSNYGRIWTSADRVNASMRGDLRQTPQVVIRSVRVSIHEGKTAR